MRACQYSRFGDSSVLETREVAAPVRAQGEILVETKAARSAFQQQISIAPLGSLSPDRNKHPQHHSSRLSGSKRRLLQISAALPKGMCIMLPAPPGEKLFTRHHHDVMQTPGCDFAGLVLESDPGSQVHAPAIYAVYQQVPSASSGSFKPAV